MRRFFLLPLLLFALASCNESGLGIFYSISREDPLEDTTLPNDLSVSGMVKSSETYYVCAGGLYSRDISDGELAPWNPLEMPSNEYDLCLALLEFKGSFYGFFSNTAADSTQIFTSEKENIAWSAVGVFDSPIVGLAASESSLFVTERVDPVTYRTTASADGIDFSTTLALNPPNGVLVTDAVDFPIGTTWLIGGPYLYSGSGTTYTQITPPGSQTNASFGGLYVSDDLGPRLFVSDSAGHVYATADGSTWESATVTDDAGNPVVLYDMEEVSILDAQVVVVGAKNGYYDIVFEDGTYSSAFSLQIPGSEAAGAYSSSDANFLNIDLRRSAIRMFFFDGAGTTLFAGTSGNGLWVNPISGTTAGNLTRKWDRQ